MMQNIFSIVLLYQKLPINTMGGIAMFEQSEIHNVLISASFFERATSHQHLNSMVLGYLHKNYQNYRLLEIDIPNRLAICERSEIDV